jgi:RNA polymerase sigma factor (sigma-70 family)
MSPPTENHEQRLLAAAQRGDEGAFARLVGPYRGELQAHAYRMVGSLHDAEDAMQDSLLRAWRGIGRFEGRSSLRTWLYTITTNSSLRLIERRPKRVLPIDFGPPADPHEPPGKPLVESAWVEPFPDERLTADQTETSPEARYELRESVELAFTAAMQHLPPRAEWFQGREAVTEFLPRGPLQRRWKLVPVRANGGPAFGCYWADADGSLHAEGILLLDFTQFGEISQITTFRDSNLLPEFGLPLAMDPEGSSDL